jgi:hypothetical protein
MIEYLMNWVIWSMRAETSLMEGGRRVPSLGSIVSRLVAAVEASKSGTSLHVIA